MKLFEYAHENEIRTKKLLEELDDEGYPASRMTETTDVPDHVLRKISGNGNGELNGAGETTNGAGETTNMSWREELEQQLNEWVESTADTLGYTIGTVKLLTDENCSSTRETIFQEIKHIGRNELNPLEKRTHNAIQVLIYWPEKLLDKVPGLGEEGSSSDGIVDNLRNRTRKLIDRSLGKNGRVNHTDTEQ